MKFSARLIFALALAMTPAFANTLTATGSISCTGYTVDVTAGDLPGGSTFTVNYTITLTPTVGAPVTTSGSIADNSPGFSSFENTATVLFAVPAGTYTVSGTVVLLENGVPDGTAVIAFSSTVLSCGGGGGGGSACPATIGFWKHHAFPNSVQTSGLSIGGVTYPAADLLTILNANGGNAVVILGRQLVGALLNQAAGGKDNASADAAITTAEALLSVNHLNLLTSVVAPSSTLGQALTTQATVLNNYNNADFGKCSEGSGLILGN